MSTKKVSSNINFSDLIPFCVFPNSFIRNGKLTTQQKVLFEILCSYDFVDSNGKRKGWCSVSLETISEQMGIEKRSVQYHLKALVKLGMVTIVYRNNKQQSSIYILNILPGLSEYDRQRIAATRTTEIKNLISGLNTIKVQTSEGFKYISEKEFDLQYLITGERSNEIIEGEIVDVEELVDNEVDELKSTDLEDFKEFNITNCVISDSSSVCNSSVNISVSSNNNLDSPSWITKTSKSKQTVSVQNNDLKISFKKPPEIKLEKINSKELNSSNYNSKDAVARILAGNYNNLKYIDYCKYFKHKYEIKYKTELYVIDRKKDLIAIKNLLNDLEPELIIHLIDFYISKYDTMFANIEYPRPKVYQLNIKWILSKVLEQYYLYIKAEEDLQKPKIEKKNVTTIIL